MASSATLGADQLCFYELLFFGFGAPTGLEPMTRIDSYVFKRKTHALILGTLIDGMPALIALCIPRWK